MINNMNKSINSTAIRPGTILSTSRAFYRHFGIASDTYANGHPMVISNSGAHGMVVEESLDQFQGQGDLKIEGYWGMLPPQEVLSRAKKELGSSYSLLAWNCEHFVRLAHGIKPESPQVVFMAVLCIGVLFAVGLSRA